MYSVASEGYYRMSMLRASAPQGFLDLGFSLWYPAVIQGLPGPYGRRVWASWQKGTGKWQIARRERGTPGSWYSTRSSANLVFNMLKQYHFVPEREHQEEEGEGSVCGPPHGVWNTHKSMFSTLGKLEFQEVHC